MDNAITAALSRQMVLARALDTTANNVANQSTPGFKADTAQFREYLALVNDRASGDPVVSLVHDPDTVTDFSAGGVTQTYRDLDFAIDGDGFFAVETEAGVRYTRSGSFVVNATGELVARSGARVLDASEAPIVIDPENGSTVISPNGEIQQNGATVGEIGIFTFDEKRALRKSGDNLFASSESARKAEFPRVRQGFLEASNVNPVAAMTDLIEIMRAYEQAADIARTASDLERRAIETLAA